MKGTTAQQTDPRIEQILDILLQLASGDLTVRATPSDQGDALDAVMTGLNMLAEELAAQIGKLEHTQQQLQQTERKYRELVDKIDDGILAVDAQGHITFANQAWAEMLGFEQSSELLGGQVFDYITPEDRERVLDIFRMDIERGRPTTLVDSSIIRRDGSIRHVQIHPTIIVEQDEVVGARAVIRDTTERRKHEEEIAFRASHDSLTGLPNRATVMQSLDFLMAQAKRSGGFIALLFLDLDEFKLVNDTLGHEAGDELLRMTAERLNETIRASDLVARLGGDEFVILLISHCQIQTEDLEEIEACISKQAQ